MKWLVSVALVAAVLLAGCDSNSGASGGDRLRTEDGLKSAVKDYFEAYSRGDAESAYRGFSKSCRDGTSLDEFGRTVGAAGLLFEKITHVKFSDVRVTEIRVRNFSDGRAEAAAFAVTPEGKPLSESPDFSPYAVEDGRWVRTNCAEMRIFDRSP